MPASHLRQQINEASAQAVALLDERRGPIEPPIRSEIFGIGRFQQHGRSLGQVHVAECRRFHRASFYPRIRQNIEVLREAHAFIGLQEHVGHHVSPAGEWLLDNFHLVVDQIKAIHEGLPRSYFRKLPVLLGAHLEGMPRIYGVAWAFVAHTDSAFDEPLLLGFLEAYQQSRELTLGELWALPTTLRVLLIDNLRRLSERVAADKAARELANLWCDGLADANRPMADPAAMFGRMRARGVDRAFALQVMQRLHADSGAGDSQAGRAREQIRLALALALPDPAAAQAGQQADETADNLSVSNAISALRLLGQTEWRSLIGQASLVMQLMQDSAVYRAESDETQDSSLHMIELLALRSGRSELSVARSLLELLPEVQAESAQQGVAGTEAAGMQDAPGHWLQGAGRPRLWRSLGLRPPRWSLGSSAARRLRQGLYLGTMLLLPVALSTWLMLRYAADPGRHLGWWLAGALSLWPASETVIALVHRLISEALTPRLLPRLAWTQGIPAPQRVLVVIPALLTDAATIEALARRLEQHHLANAEPQAQFALLTDNTDAAAAELPGDAALLSLAVAAVDRLEASYPPTAAARRFLLLHRPRRWSETEQAWIGWERKRGKLGELVALLSGASASRFIDLGPRSQPEAGTQHLLTLDSDTVLLPGTLRALVGVAAHPLNRPDIDLAGRRVRSGYGVVQPRVATPLVDWRERTLFHHLFAGQGGVDPYGAASSEVYQDLFQAGSFTGKGLLNVAAMQAVLAGRLPEEQVLSHDLIEGAMLRCACVNDLSLTEAAPAGPEVAGARLQRWTRGDWQLWPLLWRARSLGLGLIDRWKIIDNLRRSMVAPASVALLCLSLAGIGLDAGAALALVAAAFGAGPLLGALAGLAPSRDDIALRHFFSRAGGELLRALAGLLWQLGQLLQQAQLLAGAIVTALWRLFVTRRGLLQWTTAAQSLAQSGRAMSARQWLRRHGAVTGGALALGLLLWELDTPAPGLALGLCGLWAVSPWWALWAAALPRSDPAAQLHAAEREDLLTLARDTWRLFEEQVNESTQHLPPDNVQTEPQWMVAQRTSPTNIGLYLLSVACAREFGWIDDATLLRRCGATLDTMDRLERHRGHLLNWYDLRTLQSLPPDYVSTVDSGNLCGHLLGLAGACQLRAEAPDQTPANALALQALAERSRRWAEAAEFGFLFHARRRLFHIGYRVAEQQLDSSFYDLLASESRLASLWAIAKGDVPLTHWAALGRPFFAIGADAGLRSWSGSMFEYLMPALVLDEPPGSVLADAARAAVHEQQRDAALHQLPWGMSESAYAAVDHTLAYQYAPQGVPRLALRRTPADERVIAPYATVLATMVEPRSALANLKRLELLGARGRMGFVEALDYSPERQTDGRAFTLVSTFMAHHQGMSLVALTNVLCQAAPRRWTMADARLGAMATLLQEPVPRELSRLTEPPPASTRLDRRQALPGASWLVQPGDSALQPTQLMSNGRYSVALRANGAGWSRFRQADLTRWRDDALRDAYGQFFYIRRDALAAPHSLTQHPAPDPAAHYQASFQSDRVCLEARWVDLRSRCTVWVSPEDDIEMRRIELWNTSQDEISLELISMFEVALGPARADEAHPAFANLFVGAEWDPAQRALYLVRRPRLAGESELHAVHFVAHADVDELPIRARADRARWQGRHRDAAHPLARFDGSTTPAGPLATGLDPVAALSMRLLLPAHGRVVLHFATAAADNRAALEILIDRYRQRSVIERSSLMSGTFAGIRLREMRVPAEDRIAIQLLSTALCLLHSRLASELLPAAAMPAWDRRSLWRFGLSGDRPLIVVRISAVHGMRLVRSLVQALRWWSWGGLACELVIVNGEPASYLLPLQHELAALQERRRAEADQAERAGLCQLLVVQAAELSAEEAMALQALARVRLHADGRSLAHHVQDWVALHDQALDGRQAEACSGLPPPAWSLPAAAPAGRFDDGGRAFRFSVAGAHRPTRPWINLLANPGFGAQISDAGAGFSWAGNSRLHQISSWSNDPVADPSGEGLFLQDLVSRELWSVGAGIGATDERYSVAHGQGWSRIAHQRAALRVEAIWCVDSTLALRQVRLVLRNEGSSVRRLRVIGTLEWQMGEQRLDRQSLHCQWRGVPARSPGAAVAEVLLATQCDRHAGFGGSTAFASLQRSGSAEPWPVDWTCDRRELFDARGRPVFPDHFGERQGSGLDPCAALAGQVRLAPGEQVELVWLLGHADSPEAALALASAALAVDAGRREQQAIDTWDELLGRLQVQTPDPLFDVLVNRWLLYQTLACRLWARAGFYQAGGAFGYRDQLQDAMALAVVAPDLLRRQLLLAASRQFVEGDVQHWWHDPTGAGVRTHCSDDLLWLPQAVLRYLALSDEVAVLDEPVGFLHGPPIPTGAEDLYFIPEASPLSASLYEHCARSIDRSLGAGAHGLPLIGSGDWNDGMNRVGPEGRGESVWLGWWLCQLVEQFAPWAQRRGEPERAGAWTAAAAGWRQALQGPAWDGEWFVRAFFDDGSALGTAGASECRIDLIAQAWSVLSGEAPPERQRTAMASAVRQPLAPGQRSDPPARSAAGGPAAERRLHPGLSAWRARERRAVQPCRGLGPDGPGRAGRRRRRLPQLHLAQPGAPQQPSAAGRGLRAGALRDGGRCLHPAALCRSRRLELVHRFGRLDAPRRGRVDLRAGAGRCALPAAAAAALALGHDHAGAAPRRPGHTLVVCAASALEAIAQARREGALALAPGDWLVLAEAGVASRHLVVCAPR